MKRTLTVRRETLAELTPEQLTTVVGADAPPTLVLKDCLDTMQPTRCLCP